jgi:ATP-binding cassette subfamily B protein
MHAGSVAAAAAALEIDAEPIDATFGDLDTLLRTAAPAVLRLHDDGFVMLVSRRGRRLQVIRPDHRSHSVRRDVLRRAVVDPAAAPLARDLERLVDEAGVASSRRDAAVRALIADRLRRQRLEAGWLIRPRQSASFILHLRGARVPRQVLLLALAHVAQYSMLIAAWYLLGLAALTGRLDRSWLTAWALALCTLVPLQVATTWLQGRVAIVAGALLKQRLLAGALRLDPEEIRAHGAGQLLGRVLESDVLSSLALGGGLSALLAVLELGLATAVLAFASPLLPAVLVLWIALTGILTATYLTRRRDWARYRISLTHDLIERMVGHRTRIAQQPREEWHDGEDEALDGYARASQAMDRTAAVLIALVPRGWIVVGLCALTPLFVRGGSPAALAIGVGGIVLAFRALERLTFGLWNVAGALIAWEQVAPVFEAAARNTLDPPPVEPPPPDAAPARTILDAMDLRFTHRRRGAPVLHGCTLAIEPKDRIVLEGASGSGKSTLAALLAGLRSPESGLLLLDGLDRPTLGLDEWRRRVVLVPQFHENHVMLGSMAFNALMGTAWPPDERQLAQADAVLRELGLGDTLDRMPSGVIQTIGETGWQLSHGERSRLFLARALLQNPEVLILDESFAQLDPENTGIALDVIAARDSAVLLIAHP